jgi:hypothetical protein
MVVVGELVHPDDEVAARPLVDPVSLQIGHQVGGASGGKYTSRRTYLSAGDVLRKTVSIDVARGAWRGWWAPARLKIRPFFPPR